MTRKMKAEKLDALYRAEAAERDMADAKAAANEKLLAASVRVLLWFARPKKSGLNLREVMKALDEAVQEVDGIK